MCRKRIGALAADQGLLVYNAITAVLGGKSKDFNESLKKVRDG